MLKRSSDTDLVKSANDVIASSKSMGPRACGVPAGQPGWVLDPPEMRAQREP